MLGTVVCEVKEDRPFLKGERVYLPVGEGVTAPDGFVFSDDGGDLVEVVRMQPVFGVTRLRTTGSMLVPADRLRRDRRGRLPMPLAQVPRG